MTISATRLPFLERDPEVEVVCAQDVLVVGPAKWQLVFEVDHLGASQHHQRDLHLGVAFDLHGLPAPFTEDERTGEMVLGAHGNPAGGCRGFRKLHAPVEVLVHCRFFRFMRRGWWVVVLMADQDCVSRSGEIDPPADPQSENLHLSRKTLSG
ncbi:MULTISPECIES: hypothetical protein [unclassified Paracoccus (in: a-proteobacteria)]|uniref:hypothetical protein n=1 Tax=unclassified Paracoccus (in: a-proteobacteria) TaxID=2688777 RepID=UPI001601C056|nr:MULTISPECIES: hypothetical protein [unclassified Paracoccus (in: a-proteobacteria)]MBB1492797.1 hypothetical protein [Paracoccus sp. MC1854]MBB1499278.1 hypothetical protein [Paracoccus sp. MC1862]QQO45824.1 hypothetical protein JGR78_05820 [Paracoccus sp. MC1862]